MEPEKGQRRLHEWFKTISGGAQGKRNLISMKLHYKLTTSDIIDLLYLTVFAKNIPREFDLSLIILIQFSPRASSIRGLS